jgi:hypothetical protein
MRKISDVRDSYECALRSSLSAIKQARDQLHLPTGMDTTATVLASQIELCDVLLVEISGIHSSLAKDLNHTRGAPQPSG